MVDKTDNSTLFETGGLSFYSQFDMEDVRIYLVLFVVSSFLLITVLIKGLSGGISMIIFIGSIWFFVSRIRDNTPDFKKWKNDNRIKSWSKDRFTRKATIFEKAIEGSTISREKVNKWIFDEICYRIKNRYDLDEEQMVGLLDDKEKLREILGDEVLYDFLSQRDLEGGDLGDGKFSKMIISKSSETYENELRDVLDRLERWGR